MPVTFSVPATGQTFTATVDNISMGGVLLLTEAPLAEGTRLVMHLPITEDMTMRVEASLVRSASAGELGVAFVSLTDEELDRISEFVEQRGDRMGL
jgi:hypothetical protein